MIMTGGASFVSLRFERPAAKQRRAASCESNPAVTTVISAEGILPGSGSGAPSGTNEVCHPVMSGGFEASATFCTPGRTDNFSMSAAEKFSSFFSSE